MVYYIAYNGQTVGPMSREQVISYGVNRDTLISADGGDWRPLYTYPELMELLAQSQPAGFQRQVSFGEAIARGFKNYFTFSGRASRSEYWWWQLFYWIVSTIVQTIFIPNLSAQDLLANPMPDSMLYPMSIVTLFFLIPTLALSVRRLHDTGRSGWWVLLSLILCIGQIILLVWYCQPSKEETNEYGPVPNVE